MRSLILRRALVLAAAVLVAEGCGRKEAPIARAEAGPAEAKERDALAAAIDAYVYGYPLVTMEMTRRVSTNVEKPEGSRAPMGQFAKLRECPAPSDHMVTAPNADTLYAIVWLDVSTEPWVVTIPDFAGRYALFPMLDAWTEVFEVPGKRTTGTGAQTFAITGPGWSGTLPKGVKEYTSPTGMVWLLGRIYCTGTPGDYRAVHALQNRMSAVPLSAYGKPYGPEPGKVDPAVDMRTSVRDQVNALDAASYFRLLAALMRANPPNAADAPMVAKLGTIGIVPGQDFDPAKLDPAVARGVAAAPKAAQAKIMGWFREGIRAGDSKLQNGWLFSTKTGRYGTNYIQRALTTAIGLGANRPQDTVYPTSETDAEGKPYQGANKYVMHFEKGQMPPAEAFWSLTMYDDAFFFYPNPLNRQNLSSRSKLKENPDGSVDLFVQHDSPGREKVSNWLPSPAGRFILMLRLYWPRESPPSIIDGSWKVPPVKKVL
jgi:hypothetical protein